MFNEGDFIEITREIRPELVPVGVIVKAPVGRPVENRVWAMFPRADKPGWWTGPMWIDARQNHIRLHPYPEPYKVSYVKALVTGQIEAGLG